MSEARVQEATIESLGHLGEGVARGARGPLFISGALPGEVVRARIENERGALVEILQPSPDRIAPICPHFGACGGCATQHLGPSLYAAWKHDILAGALAKARLSAPLGPLVDACGEGRRRATFHARFPAGRGATEVGFMRARTHAIVEIEACPVLAPEMAGALDAARRVAESLRGLGKPLDILVTATLSGLDVDIKGCGPLDLRARQALIETANRCDLARIANHGEIVMERRPPEVRMGAALVLPPPGAFLQSTAAGERALAERALAAVEGARRVADLFCGVGAFALRLAARHEAHAVELDRPALAALERAAATTPGLRPVTCEARDLFRRPLRTDELEAFDAVLFDPPRAGAEAQSRELAASAVPTIVAISCNAGSFARDMRILTSGGYALESVTPIDQFRFSPHIEIVGVLRKAPARRRRKGLLG